MLKTKEILKKPMVEFSDPNVWIKFARLAQITKSTNMGQGFPDWAPPKFYFDFLQKNIADPNANHQYTRAFGNLNIIDAISKDYSKYFHRKVDPLNEITVSAGGCAVLYNTITSLVSPGDEICFIEPFYESYLPQAKFSGAKVVGVPLIPPKKRKTSEYAGITTDVLKTKIKDDWTFDYKTFEASLNEKTKFVIINSPNNPTGKIYSMEELTEISRIIVKKSPNAIVISDEVYEHIYYDDHQYFPRIANVPGMWDRTVSIYSAGKIFSCTGIRVGWAIGAESIIKAINVCHQYNAFCLYEPIQNTIADCLNHCDKPFEGFNTYFDWYRNQYNLSRNHLINGIVHKTNLFQTKEWKMDFWMPEGAYFLVGDISEADVKQEFVLEGEEGKKYSKDFAYAINMANKQKVNITPLSIFYTPEHRHLGDNYVRFSFCKKLSTIDSAINSWKI